jgi:hypothetical protein
MVIREIVERYHLITNGEAMLKIILSDSSIELVMRMVDSQSE